MSSRGNCSQWEELNYDYRELLIWLTSVSAESIDTPHLGDIE